VAGFRLECMAGFIGIRIPEVRAKFDAKELEGFENALAGWKKHFEAQEDQQA
jgi:hypothetical protein